ncbi:MAG: DUF4435 domain-containing protein [Bacteroides sp.]|nr:DUF4435 domain-containing protein [Bacteroides sp.]
MKLTLPPRIGGQPLEVDTAENRQIIIIGANGSGKTRFADRMMADLGPKAFRMSAIKALYGRDEECRMEGSIDQLYHKMTDVGAGIIRRDIKGELERLLALMLQEEMENLIRFKYPAEDTADDAEDDRTSRRKVRHARRDLLPTTRLDRLIGLWQKIFPDNRILIESGRLIFGSESSDDTYSSSKLSAGEKAVLYYIGASMFAPADGIVFVESPALFLHPSSTRSLWDTIEALRPDCTFIYVTHDLSFASTRGDGTTVWVKNCDSARGEWDYDFMTSADGLNDEVFLAIVGARKPVLFIEGDGINSIDAKLYPLIFPEYTVKSLGGCDRVIESTRTFNSLRAFHNLDARGIVDRDRRDEGEVSYLRNKRIFVPNVAEIENIFMIEEVIRSVARYYHRDEDAVFAKVRKAIMRLFETDLRQQALMHTRHIVKKTVEHRLDGRFANINKLEEHINDLCQSINPRGIYEQYCRDFRRYIAEDDYASVLRVYNRKTMLSESHVARACGLRRDDKDSYIRAILTILKEDRAPASAIRSAIRATFGID